MSPTSSVPIPWAVEGQPYSSSDRVPCALSEGSDVADGCVSGCSCATGFAHDMSLLTWACCCDYFPHFTGEETEAKEVRSLPRASGWCMSHGDLGRVCATTESMPFPQCQGDGVLLNEHLPDRLWSYWESHRADEGARTLREWVWCCLMTTGSVMTAMTAADAGPGHPLRARPSSTDFHVDLV